MRTLLALGTAASLVTVAACNRGDDSARSENATPPPGNAAAASTNAADNAAEPELGPEQVAALMHERHEDFERMGKAFGAINRELKGGSPDVPLIQRHAASIDGYSRELLTWFPAGSGPETGRETRAKAEIWQDLPTFRQRGEAFRAEAGRFAQAAQGGDVAAIRTAVRPLGESCKNCHDRFRAPEHR